MLKPAIDLLDRLLYRDGLILILNKPEGIPVHGGPKGGPTLETYFEVLKFGLPSPPRLAHRLDRETSGCLILGRHRQALERLRQLFATQKIEKTYWALVEGQPSAAEGWIDLPLAKRSATRGWWMKVDPSGAPAQTHWKVLGSLEASSPSCPSQPLTFLALTPLTGRTHQLRVHCAAQGWPILGDAIYGKAAREHNPLLHLHAQKISLPLYKNKDSLWVEAPAPPHMAEKIRAWL